MAFIMKAHIGICHKEVPEDEGIKEIEDQEDIEQNDLTGPMVTKDDHATHTIGHTATLDSVPPWHNYCLLILLCFLLEL